MPPCGSGQSAASLAADKAVQRGLFAAAAARNSCSPIAKKPKARANGKTKLLDLSKQARTSRSGLKTA